MAYWLMKSEPDVFSFDDMVAKTKRGEPEQWHGVRNYTARNNMVAMALGDLAFFYHSSCAEPGIAGIVKVAKKAYPDITQFDPASEYHDPKSTPDEPRWMNVDMKLVKKTRLVPLTVLRAHPELAGLRILQRGNRLSITPVEPAEWAFIAGLIGQEG